MRRPGAGIPAQHPFRVFLPLILPLPSNVLASFPFSSLSPVPKFRERKTAPRSAEGSDIPRFIKRAMGHPSSLSSPHFAPCALSGREPRWGENWGRVARIP